jgi:hypothetical protein
MIKTEFGRFWSSISAIPGTAQASEKHLSGQLLFTSDPNQENFIFCPWWPWGDGKTISIRIAPSHKKLADSEKAELIKLLKGWFGLSD